MWSGLADRLPAISKIWRGGGCQQSPLNGGDRLPSELTERHAESEPRPEPSPDQVRHFLRAHPEVLERYVMEEVELEQLERWMIRGTQRSKKRLEANGAASNKNGRKTSLSRWKFCVHADKRQMLQEMTKSLQQRPTQAHVLWELAGCISSAVGAEGHRLYLTDRSDPEQLTLYLGQDSRVESGEPRVQPLGPGLSAPSFVARTREPLRLSRGEPDPRFPDWLPLKGDRAHVLYQPVVQPDGQLAAVVELWRRDPGPAFHEEDEEIASSYLVWGGIALHYAHLYLKMDKQRKLNDFLLAVVKSIFQDMVSMDALVIKVMNFAQRLVDADRASLFLVDARNKELYARIFDVGVGSNEEVGEDAAAPETLADDGATKVPTPKEIRFPLGTGIAGQVALTGEVLNITDAYCDPRFNRTVDQLTGYHTKSILCMPIFIRGFVIGVVQMVNKHSGSFSKQDEEAFEMFAVYCGLALHHATLYDKIARSEQKYRVALEVLSYHNTCSETEVRQAITLGIPDSIPGVDDYYFSVFSLDDYQKAYHAIFMFKDLFGLSLFDSDSLIKFTLTVRKNYRRVPYHNWTHGFSVANSMYSIIKHSQSTFRPNECLALYIAALCHDLDHRGKNNKFMLETESPLASIYSTSTMEHHHFNQTITILQQKGHNIFSKLSNSDYKYVLSHVKHCILATDLAMFFPNRAKLTELVSRNEFSWANSEHRLLLEAIAMTASDLSASAKPWDLQVKTVKVIFEEFYEQGDAERAAGRTPIPMMDRTQPDQQAASQVGFLTGICIPCYSLLYKLIPETKPLLDQCQANLDRWRQIDAEDRKTREQNLNISGTVGTGKEGDSVIDKSDTAQDPAEAENEDNMVDREGDVKQGMAEAETEDNAMVDREGDVKQGMDEAETEDNAMVDREGDETQGMAEAESDKVNEQGDATQKEAVIGKQEDKREDMAETENEENGMFYKQQGGEGQVKSAGIDDDDDERTRQAQRMAIDHDLVAFSDEEDEGGVFAGKKGGR